MIFRGLALWFLFLFLMVSLGAFREKVLQPRLGELRAHQWGTLIACAVVFSLTALFLDFLRAVTPGDYLKIGVFWTTLTICFEFAFGRWVMKKKWTELLQDYNMRSGRLWTIFLLTLLFSPLGAAIFLDGF